MCNFSYLKKHEYYNSFADACIEAEKSIAVSYPTAAIMTRRALELAVKWLYINDEDLEMPYNENLASLLGHYTFRKHVNIDIQKKLKYIKTLGNDAVHTTRKIRKEQVVNALNNLYEFILFIDYQYSDEPHQASFDELNLPDSDEIKQTQKQLQELSDKLGSRDRTLEELKKENEELRRSLAAKKEENRSRGQFKNNDITEYKTRKLYIDLEIELAGWYIGKNCIEEFEVSGMPNDTGKGFADYVLFGDDGKPLAVIEAKKTSADPHEGKEQAKLYADCLEEKYGQRPVIFYTNGFEYYIWDDNYYPERKVSGFYTKNDLEWTLFRNKNRKPLDAVNIKDEITDRPYQKMAIQAVCDTFEKSKRKALLVMATGSGKTRTAVSLVDVLLKRGWIKNILFLADRRELVKQAKGSFKNLLPQLSLCSLLDSKDSPESRMIFSTYPTMMNAIDETRGKDGNRLFSPGHFDLIIIDESHRSIYKKYRDIFDYFDASLVGLTATPKSDIDKNTYAIFDLENNLPTFAYELDEAIEDKYLVPFHTIETTLKLPVKGIVYDELSDEEKEHFEETFDEDVDFVSGEEINSFVFNNNTVDTVIYDLMEKGIKVEGGDKPGKSIIFAKNKKHADFIIKRFNVLYPSFKDHFVKPIYTDIKYVDKVYEDFKTREKLPQIVVSVDMLDTGVDIPEIVNLVFFKVIRSKAKFRQMIGRGTRLCNDLFGIGLDKKDFRIFDYCSNFEYFRENSNGKEALLSKSLTENIFNIKADTINELQRLEYQEDGYIEYRSALVDDCICMINSIDREKFNAGMKIKYILKFSNRKNWEALSDSDLHELKDILSPIIPSIDDEELAKRFDYLMLTIIYAEVSGKNGTRPKMMVLETAEKLSKLGTIKQVQLQSEIIKTVLSEGFWDNATIFDCEKVRTSLRELIKFIDTESKGIYYTNFSDEILSVREGEGEYFSDDFESYRKKVDRYLKTHEDDIAIYKLRNNKVITEYDVKHLEKVLWEDLGTADDYKEEFGDQPLLEFVTKSVGLEAEAANRLFSKFLSNNILNKNQMEFVKLIVRYVINNGVIDKSELAHSPFSDYGLISELFEDRIDVVNDLVSCIDELNNRICIVS